MSKKFAFLVAGLIFLCGCSSSHGSAAREIPHSDTAVNNAVAEAAKDSAAYGASSEQDSDPPVGMETTLADGACSEIRYFRFDRKTNQIYGDDGQELVYEQYCDATYRTPDQAEGEWVDSIVAGIEQDYSANSENLLEYAQDILSFYGDDISFYSYSNYQELGIARHDSRVVSLISLSSLYSGGAHPGSMQTTYNLDLLNLRLLLLEDVIYQEQSETLSQMVLEAVREKFALLENYGLFEDYETTITNSMSYGNMTPYWYLNDVGLVIFYNQYELAPYAAGIIKVELSYEKLEGILREEYFPVNADGQPGDLVLRSDWTGYNRISISIDDEGQRILVGAEGEVCQIQLSEVFWMEGQPVLQQMLFSADCLSQMDVLEIIGGFDDEERSFAIEFTDGSGERTVYYVHPGALTDEP